MRKLRAFAEAGRRGNGKNQHSRYFDSTKYSLNEMKYLLIIDAQ